LQLVLQSNKNKSTTEYYNNIVNGNTCELLIDSEIATQLYNYTVIYFIQIRYDNYILPVYN